MTIRPPPPSTMSAMVSLLLPYCCRISSEKLLGALKSYEETPLSTGLTEKGRPMTKREAAALLNVSLQTIGSYIKNGSLKAGKLPGGRLIRIDSDSVAALIDYKTAQKQSLTINTTEVSQ